MEWPAVGATLAGDRPYNRSGSFNEHNRNKLAITLDLKKRAGVDLFKRLVAVSDVVIDNFSVGVMERLGLGYEALKAVRPDVIVLSSRPSATPGRSEGYIGYRPVQEQLSGVTSITGYPGGPPLETGFYYGDPSAGLQAAGAIMTALWSRRRTGRGQFVDLSQRETLVSFLGEMILDQQMNGRDLGTAREPRRLDRAPGGLPLPGRRRLDRDQLPGRRRVAAALRGMGRPDLADDPRYRDVSSRSRRHDELDATIADWTREYEHLELTERLQRGGVAGTAVLATGSCSRTSTSARAATSRRSPTRRPGRTSTRHDLAALGDAGEHPLRRALLRPAQRGGPGRPARAVGRGDRRARARGGDLLRAAGAAGGRLVHRHILMPVITMPRTK